MSSIEAFVRIFLPVVGLFLLIGSPLWLMILSETTTLLSSREARALAKNIREGPYDWREINGWSGDLYSPSRDITIADHKWSWLKVYVGQGNKGFALIERTRDVRIIRAALRTAYLNAAVEERLSRVRKLS